MSSPVIVSARFREWTEESLSSSFESPSYFFPDFFFLKRSFSERVLEVSTTATSTRSILPSEVCLRLLPVCLGLVVRGGANWDLEGVALFCPFFRERLWNCSQSGSGGAAWGGESEDDDDVTDGDLDNGGGGGGGGGVGVGFVGVVAA